jgi:hypothetical protein
MATSACGQEIAVLIHYANTRRGVLQASAWSNSMCDYSLELVASRPAKVGDKLISAGFHHTSALMGRWLVPNREQKKSRMSPQCQQYAETDVQRVPQSEVEIFSCDDPAFAPQKTRILEFVKSANEVYRARNRPLYSETILGPMRGRARDEGATEDRSLQSERKAAR